MITHHVKHFLRGHLTECVPQDKCLRQLNAERDEKQEGGLSWKKNPHQYIEQVADKEEILPAARKCLIGQHRGRNYIRTRSDPKKHPSIETWVYHSLSVSCPSVYLTFWYYNWETGLEVPDPLWRHNQRWLRNSRGKVRLQVPDRQAAASQPTRHSGGLQRKEDCIHVKCGKKECKKMDKHQAWRNKWRRCWR